MATEAHPVASPLVLGVVRPLGVAPAALEAATATARRRPLGLGDVEKGAPLPIPAADCHRRVFSPPHGQSHGEKNRPSAT